MPGQWRRAHVERLPKLQAFDALVAIEAAMMPWTGEEQRAERLAYWRGIAFGTATPALATPAQPTGQVLDRTVGHFVPQTFDQFSGFLRRAGGRAAR